MELVLMAVAGHLCAQRVVLSWAASAVSSSKSTGGLNCFADKRRRAEGFPRARRRHVDTSRY
jgi:hypothetical protein